MALGTYVGGSGRTDGAIDTLSGGTWGAANAPPPPGASTAYPYAYVHGAVCPTVGNCVAVGSYAAQDGGGQAVIETAAGK